MHQDYSFVTSQPSSYIHQHRARQPTWVHSSHEIYGTDGPIAKDKGILEAQENMKKKERAHDVMAKRLEIAETLSTRTVNELSEKEKMIQEQAKLIEKKEKEGSSDSLLAKDKEIMGSAEKLEEELLAHAEMAKSLEECGLLSNRAMKKFSEKQKLIQEQSRVRVEKEKESKENMAAVKKREQEYEIDQQNRAVDAAACDDVKKYLKSCKKRNRLSQL